MLEIGELCIGNYSQAVITLENRLTSDAKYSLNLLDVSLDYTKNDMLVDNKPIGTNIATVLCADKVQNVPSLSEASFIVWIMNYVTLYFIIYNINIFFL